MKRIVAISVLILLLATVTGCSRSAQNADSADIIPRDLMVKIMVDLEIAEASLRFLQSKVNKDSLDKIADQTFDSLYMYYDITPTQFKSNLEIYQDDLADFEKMMDEVMLAIIKAKDSLSNTPEMPADTIMLVKK